MPCFVGYSHSIQRLATLRETLSSAPGRYHEPSVNRLLQRLWSRPTETPDAFTTAVLDALAPAQDYARSHGGQIRLVSAEEATGVVTVRLRGACASCPLSSVTLKYGVELRLRDAVPGMKHLEVLNG